MSTSMQRSSTMPILQQSAPFIQPSTSECHLSFQVGSRWSVQSYLRVKRQSQAERNVTPAEAAWFLSLPDKIRRQHFSQEEQILIRAKSELALLHSSPEIRGHLDDTQSIYERKRSFAYETKSRKSSIPSVPSIPNSAYNSPARESFESSIDGDSVDAKMANDSVLSTTVSSDSAQSFLRSPTIVDQVWDQPLAATSSVAVKAAPVSFRTSVQSSSRALPPPPISITKPLYYRDPEAKAMLRECLATPQRFDETLNFGFRKDSMVKTPGPEDRTPGTHIKSTWVEASNYFDMHGDAELSSADEIEGPATPDFMAHKSLRPKSAHHSIHSPHSSHSAAPSPAINRAPTNTSYFEDLMNRDMTLRMTLTKPELRASDEEIYGSQENAATPWVQEEEDESVDPLALQQLTFSDDVTGAYGAFAQSISKKKGIKALWFKK